MRKPSEATPNLIEFFEHEVKPRLSSERIYGEAGFSQQNGRYWRGKCPLHGGDGNNFSVDTQTLRWTCFSRCGTGSVLAYLNGGQEPRGAQWVEMVRGLAQEVGVAFPTREVAPGEMQKVQEKQQRTTLLETFWRLAQNALHSPSGKKARAYLTTQRGFAEEELQAFGVCPSVKILGQELAAAGFSPQEIAASGLLRDARWEGRVLMAWRDWRGEIGTFAARDLSEGGEPGSKYLYLSNQHGWARKKSELLLFGLESALPAARKAGFLWVVEGIFDALLLQARGVENVAAIGGGGQELAIAKLEKLAELGVSHLTLLLDNDAHPDGTWPGLEGSLAVVRAARNAEQVPVVNVVHPKNLGQCKDPDAFVRTHGVEAFNALHEGRLPAVIFQARHLLQGISPRSSEVQRRAAVDTILDLDRSLSGVNAPLERNDLLKLLATFTGYPYMDLAVLTEEWQARRQRELLEKQLEGTLREALRQRQGGTPAGQLLGDLGSELAALRARTIDAPPPFSVERLERESGEVPAGKLSGWDSLDRLDVRFNAGELAVLGARTGHGKTSAMVSLLLNWLNATRYQGTEELLVLYSAEEPEVRIYHRLLAMLTMNDGGGWTVGQIRDYLRDPYSRGHNYTWPDPASLEEARNFLSSVQNRLLIVYRPQWSVEEIEAHAHSLHKQRTIGGIMVDYLQRIPPPAGRFDRRDQEVSAIGRRLKSLSVDVATPVVVGAQINREAIPDGYARSMNNAAYENAKSTIIKARPELHHLREGGSEQEADLILGLLNYAADYRGTERLSGPTLFEIGTLKNRYGEVGKWAQLAFEGRYGRIREPRYGEEL